MEHEAQAQVEAQAHTLSQAKAQAQQARLQADQAAADKQFLVWVNIHQNYRYGVQKQMEISEITVTLAIFDGTHHFREISKCIRRQTKHFKNDCNSNSTHLVCAFLHMTVRRIDPHCYFVITDNRTNATSNESRILCHPVCVHGNEEHVIKHNWTKQRSK